VTKERLLKELTDEGYLHSQPLINAFEKIDRLDFVPADQKENAYTNNPLPIGFNQTISQPLTVAFMLELLAPKAGDKILDVGAGSGWQTALLAEIVGGAPSGIVIGIERLPALSVVAQQNISKYGFLERGTVRIIIGDGSLGYEAAAPFDKIVAAAAGKEIPPAWKAQLKVGGRLVAPVGDSIYVLDKDGENRFAERRFFGFSFVPLITGK
jgi:protein-L-isoaspartate(D-aspartate) O-methyltransferase